MQLGVALDPDARHELARRNIIVGIERDLRVVCRLLKPLSATFGAELHNHLERPEQFGTRRILHERSEKTVGGDGLTSQPGTLTGRIEHGPPSRWHHLSVDGLVEKTRWKHDDRRLCC